MFLVNSKSSDCVAVLQIKNAEELKLIMFWPCCYESVHFFPLPLNNLFSLL